MKVKSNIKDVLKAIDKFEKDVSDKVEIAMFDNAKNIELNAKRLAPVDLGKLRQGIHTRKEKDLNYSIVASEKYSAYQEFGTGAFVDLSYLTEAGYPEGYALQFKGRNENKVNMPPQPFLFPALVLGRKQLFSDLKDILNKLTKKV